MPEQTARPIQKDTRIATVIIRIDQADEDHIVVQMDEFGSDHISEEIGGWLGEMLNSAIDQWINEIVVPRCPDLDAFLDRMNGRTE